jgi:hypothetical protein
MRLAASEITSYMHVPATGTTRGQTIALRDGARPVQVIPSSAVPRPTVIFDKYVAGRWQWWETWVCCGPPALLPMLPRRQSLDISDRW